MAFRSKDSSSKNFSEFLKVVKAFSGFGLVLLGCMFFVSILEILIGASNHSLDTSLPFLISLSWLADIKFFGLILFPLFLLYILVSIVDLRQARLLIITLAGLFFLVQLALIFYYNSTLLMLGSDLFGYSFDEVSQTVGASGSINFLSVAVFVGVMALIIIAFTKLPQRIYLPGSVAIIFPAASFLFIVFGISGKINPETLSSDFEKGLVQNKSAHFYTAAYFHFNPENYETDIYADNYIGDYFKKYKAEPIEFLSEEEFPFLHKETTEDVLSPFLGAGEIRPNIVIIVVEGLGRAFSNRGAYLGNFTPFLDSLSTKSLYWPNFLSNGGRTFAVLPSLLGSSPFGRTGFMEMEKMPQQLSLLNLLEKNGYETSFYYGGNSQFDNMAFYLKENSIDKIRDEKTVPADSYSKIPASNTGFTWGYGDKELFRYYLNTNSADTLGRPKLSILLTLSTHSPFITAETQKYSKKFEDKMNFLGFDEDKKKVYRDYKEQYASILFTDDALKNFFSEYEKREDFENTIFIITGDHRIPEIPMASKIDRYHVPLMIYSPLLKRTAEIESISSHFDVAPSLIAYLKNNFNIKVPLENSFIGEGLDTTRYFQNIHQIPLKQTKTELIDFVMGEYHLNGDQLYQLQSGMTEKLINDPGKREELRSAFNQFKRKNAEIVSGKKLLPDSIVTKYIK